jgi:hypothetical protein
MFDSLDDFQKLLMKKEELDKELLRYYRVLPKSKVVMINHPLVSSTMYSPAENALLNARLNFRKAERDQYWADGKWDKKPYRFQALMDVQGHLGDREYWTLCREVWINSENIWQNVDGWRELLSASRPHKERFMTGTDRRTLKSLPSKITVYRGYQPRKNKNGLSFTLDREKAEWFANRFWKTGKIWVRTVSKDNVFAYTNDRDEKEIIIL